MTELGLVLLGAWLYWRAALRTTNADRRRLAHVAGAAVLASGILTLALDLAGL